MPTLSDLCVAIYTAPQPKPAHLVTNITFFRDSVADLSMFTQEINNSHAGKNSVMLQLYVKIL